VLTNATNCPLLEITGTRSVPRRRTLERPRLMSVIAPVSKSLDEHVFQPVGVPSTRSSAVLLKATNRPSDSGRDHGSRRDAMGPPPEPTLFTPFTSVCCLLTGSGRKRPRRHWVAGHQWLPRHSKRDKADPFAVKSGALDSPLPPPVPANVHRDQNVHPSDRSRRNTSMTASLVVISFRQGSSACSRI